MLRRTSRVCQGCAGVKLGQENVLGLDECAVLDAAAGLVDKSLVKLEHLEPPRYLLAETSRLYARERLRDAGEAEAALRCHGEVMARLCFGYFRSGGTLKQRPGCDSSSRRDRLPSARRETR